jgi:hypothetical protein
LYKLFHLTLDPFFHSKYSLDYSTNGDCVHVRVINSARYCVYNTEQNRAGLFILQMRVQARDLHPLFTSKWTKISMKRDKPSKEKCTRCNMHKMCNHVSWIVEEVLSEVKILNIPIHERYKGTICMKNGIEKQVWKESSICSRTARQPVCLNIETRGLWWSWRIKKGPIIWIMEPL